MINFLKLIYNINDNSNFFIKVSVISLLHVFIIIMFYHSLSIVKKFHHLPDGHVYLYNNIIYI